MVKEGETLKPERGMRVLSSIEVLNENEILGQHTKNFLDAFQNTRILLWHTGQST